jgi:hypothetical protein
VTDPGARGKRTTSVLSAAGSQIPARDGRSPCANVASGQLNPGGNARARAGSGLQHAALAPLPSAPEAQRTALDVEQILVAAERIVVSSATDRELAGHLLVTREL